MYSKTRHNGRDSPGKRRALGSLLLFLGVFTLYAPSVGFDFIHDDRQLILRQAAPTSISDLAAVFTEPHWPGLPYYRPVTRTTMVVQKALHGDRPGPYHLFNAALMGLTALVVYGLLRRRPFEVHAAPALLAAALFAVHPIASGTVYPICSGRETLLPALLVLGSVYAYLSPGRSAYVGAMLLATLSLFAKELGVIVPGLFIMADALRLTVDPPGRNVSAWLRRYAPLALVLIGYFAIRSQLFGQTLHRVALFERPEYPLLTLVYTLQTTFAPFVELVYEPRWPVWWSLPRTVVWLAGLSLLVFGVWRRRGVSRSALCFFVLWWGLALAPTANLLVQEAPFAERYGFLALLGVVGIVAMLASDLWTVPRARRAIAVGGILAVAICAVISFQRGQHFSNELRFATQWVRSDAESYKAQLNLGQSYVELERWEEASTHLGIASRLRPRSAVIHNGLAYALWRRGDEAGAATHYEKTIRLSPDLAAARTSYGDLLMRQGDTDAAIEQYQHAARLTPRDARTHRQLARALRRGGSLDRARRHFERSLALEPESAITHFELGALLEGQGDRQRAADRYREALRIRPDLIRAKKKLARIGSQGGEADAPRAPR